MDAEIRIGMRLGVCGDFGNPWSRDHHARGRDGAFVERLKARRIYRVRGSEIIRVQNQQLGVGWIPESLGDCPSLGRQRWRK
jgi:hypothetical protein